MYEFLAGQGILVQTLVAAGFAWAMTAVGAAAVFFLPRVNFRALDTALGFAAGVMIAACFFSMLLPSIEISKSLGLPAWLPPSVGFLAGALFIGVIDRILPHLHTGLAMGEAEGVKTKLHRSTLLVLSITLHNIPEGLAIGIAFGALASQVDVASLATAMALAIGIGIQDIPEGLAVSAPLVRLGMSRLKAFMYGQLSGLVEPLAAVAGAAAVFYFQNLLPYALAFGAGAMFYVVVEEVIPESQSNHNSDAATVGAVVGFLLMMMLEIALSK
jgi:ZIP family zinc transporter